MNILRCLKRLIRNLRYLCTHDLGNKSPEYDRIYHTVRHIEDLMDARMVFVQDDSVKVLSESASWEKLLAGPGSFVRLSDGELTLIEGKSIAFQVYDEKLADYLKEILQSDRTDLYTGIEYMYFHGFDNITDAVRRHNYIWGPSFKKTLLRYCNPDREYLSASINQMYMNHIEYDWERYLKSMEELFQNRDIVVFAGKGIFDSLQYKLFDCAESCEYVWALSRNAFSQFDELLEKARKYTTDKTLCFILGPTSKPLVYELSKEGYTAWDIGHMAKDYDCCKRKAPRSEADIVRFYAPD